MAHLWFVKITTWARVSINAEHWYATLEGAGRKFRIERLLDFDTAVKLTAKDAFTWNEGDLTNRFDTEESALKAAVAVYEAYAGKDDALILGDPCYLDPQPAIRGPEKFLEVARVINVDCKRNNWWEGSQANMRALADRWDLVLEHYDLHKELDYTARTEDAVVKREGDRWVFVPERP